ncbi:ABC transporter ATP-binding protein [Clostridium tyrobutyricum]|uniref:ABC transporter ATP-binding protein n=1 Tax=Clostridium tyrobutyricum TaxID=1519 RepID=UPI0020CDC4A1|nr:ABC transporter ATP-binding protein [Clostridium tyrobutyricum]
MENLEKISVRNVEQFYQHPTDKKAYIKVLENINLDIYEGQFVCLVGPSGCGKSTLLNIIGGLIKPTKGDVLVDSSKVNGPGSDRGMVFQGYALLPWRTVLKNVELGLEINKVPKKDRKRMAREFIDLVGLSKYEKYYPGQLSGGMRQRVAIARGLAYNPKVLLMDEPFSALDAQTREILQYELLNIWEKTKKTIVFVTHSVDEAIYLANEVVILGSNPGRVVKKLNVDLSYPRSHDNSEFQKLRKEIWSEISQQVNKSSNTEDRKRSDDYEIA